MTATKLLGQDVMEPNTLVFRASIERQSRMPLDQYYDSDLAVTGRYGADVRWGQDYTPVSGQCVPPCLVHCTTRRLAGTFQLLNVLPLVALGEPKRGYYCRWHHGQLLTFGSSTFHKASLGLITHSNAESADMVWMSRITLPEVE